MITFSRPVEVWTDSNSSECDEPINYDSRQDTSLDYIRENQLEANRDDQLASSSSDVMDADLRQTNKLNLELMMLQNVAQNMMSNLGGQQNSQLCERVSRSKSLTGSSTGFSQSGVLAAASEHWQQVVEGRKSRTSSGDHDSGIGALSDSRKSSLSQSGSVFGQHPTLSVQISPVISQEVSAGQSGGGKQAATGSRSILNTLASIGRSSSQSQSEQVFELQLLEARNLWPRRDNSNQLEGEASEDLASAGRSRSRRESLLGALMAAGSSRRNSVEGIYVRVFKHLDLQSELAADSISVHSSQSVKSTGADYVQLPLVKLTSNELSANQQVRFEPSSYRLTCRESEFPVRLSLYQVSRRTGARLTLGHCFVSLDDCQLAASRSHQLARTCSESSSCELADAADSNQAQRWAKFEPSASQDSNGTLQLHYKLYQTILEAIK